VFIDDFEDGATKHLHQSFKQPRAFTPTCMTNSVESFHEALKQGALQLPLDLDPAELSKLFDKRRASVPDSFASLSEYSSTFRAALWEGAWGGVGGELKRFVSQYFSQHPITHCRRCIVRA